MNVESGQRLALWRKEKNLSQRELGSILGVSQGYIGDIEAGRSEPSRSFLQKLSERYGISADWLLNGHGTQLHAPIPSFAARKYGRIEPPDYGKPAHGDFAYDDEEYVMIERFDLSVSAGNGLVPVEGAAKERLAFSRSWLLRNAINADLAVLVKVKGDSMAPTIADGATVLIHVVENVVKHEGVYAFTRDGACYVKRLIPAGISEAGRPTVIVILSDNPAYPPESLSGHQLNELHVIGRVRCAMTEF